MLKSIKSKLIIFSISLILFTIIPVVLAVNILINKSVEDGHMRNVTQQVNVIEQMLGVFYDDLDRNIDMFASHNLIKSADNSITDYLQSQGEKMTPSKNGGIEQKIFEEFKNYAKNHPGTLYVYMGTEDGGYVQWPETNNSANYDPRKRPWYRKGLEGRGEVMRTDPYTDSVTGSLIVSNVRTFNDSSGRRYGLVAIDVSSSKLAEIMNGIKIGKTGYAVMLHKSGLVLADPKNPENNLKKISDLKIENFSQAIEKEKAVFETEIKDKKYQVSSFQSAKTDWVIAVFIEKKELTEVSGRIRNLVLGIASIVILIIGVITSIISARAIRPINKMVYSLKDIAEGEGDLTMRIKIDNRDEIGEMAWWFNVFIEKLQGIVKEISENSRDVDVSAGELTLIADELAKGAENTANRSENVASAAEEMSTNLGNVAAAMEEASINASMVATASEEMTSTIDEISNNADKAKTIADQAVLETEEASKEMTALDQAVMSISQVTETISDISDQTNLLALNATIESARAGEAGKGFAVVANEIKELAQQTAEATLDIKRQIEGVQGTTSGTVEKISNISNVIQNVNEIVVSIATSVEEQTAATKEIADNISQASSGVQLVNENVNQSSDVAANITKDISEVNTEASAISDSSSKVTNSASHLKNMATKLNAIVGKFKV